MTMHDDQIPGAKIWRYINLTKFVSLLGKQALWFSSPAKFSDPYEGTLPKSHLKALSDMRQNWIDNQLAQLDALAKMRPLADFSKARASMEELRTGIQKMLRDVALKFGVNCWHMSEHESDAMWRLYPNCIAIQSTWKRLHDSLLQDGVYIDPVRYNDFENDPIEKGHRHQNLFIKRKSFEYEKELRAVKMLDNVCEGQFISCDLSVLIERVYVSPVSEFYVLEVVKDICFGGLPTLKQNVEVKRSTLLDVSPDYL